MSFGCHRVILFIVFAVVASVPLNVFGSDELPAPPKNQKAAEEPFPLEIRLLGFVQRANSVAVLVSIENEQLILWKDQPTEIVFGDPNESISVEFQSIDIYRRSVVIGFPFPKSRYLPKTCQIAKVVK